MEKKEKKKRSGEIFTPLFFPHNFLFIAKTGDNFNKDRFFIDNEREEQKDKDSKRR